MLRLLRMDEPPAILAVRLPARILTDIDKALDLMRQRSPDFGRPDRRTRSDAIRAGLEAGLPLVIARLKHEITSRGRASGPVRRRARKDGGFA